MDSKKPTLVRAFFAEMSKAFDRVDHAIPLHHVIDIQASPCMVTWIHSYLSGRRERVEVNGVASSWKEPTPGASQAVVKMVQSWLSALDSRDPVVVQALFADMSKAFDRVDHAILIQRIIDTVPSPLMITWLHDYLRGRTQRVMANDKLSSWLALSNNNMLLNGKKSQALHISFSRNITVLPPFVLGGEAVPTTTVAKGLGFTFDDKLTWNDHIKSSVTKASSRLHYLRLLCKQGMDVDDLLQERGELAAITLLKNMMKPEHPLHELVPPQRHPRGDESSHFDSWADTNNMLLNGEKSQLLQICLCRSVPNPPWLTLGGVFVPWVNSAKGLRFILDKNLTLQDSGTSHLHGPWQFGLLLHRRMFNYYKSCKTKQLV
ncbi:hypothetical protein Bbelb_025360 [Branchiostoma belcheri]|nr:hypothetical protein Bbelb_025360 [Branchiostoma belcheri]